jgi:hypothetical protein
MPMHAAPLEAAAAALDAAAAAAAAQAARLRALAADPYALAWRYEAGPRVEAAAARCSLGPEQQQVDIKTNVISATRRRRLQRRRAATRASISGASSGGAATAQTEEQLEQEAEFFSSEISILGSPATGVDASPEDTELFEPKSAGARGAGQAGRSAQTTDADDAGAADTEATIVAAGAGAAAAAVAAAAAASAEQQQLQLQQQQSPPQPSKEQPWEQRRGAADGASVATTTTFTQGQAIVSRRAAAGARPHKRRAVADADGTAHPCVPKPPIPPYHQPNTSYQPTRRPRRNRRSTNPYPTGRRPPAAATA